MNQCCLKNIYLACEASQREIAALKAEQVARPDPTTVAMAERDRAFELLRRLVKRIDKAGGHSWPTEQADMREVKALLAEGIR